MNKRIVKKEIRRICGEVACESVCAALMEGADNDALRQAVIEVAMLQACSLKKVSVAFDKVQSDFATRKEYNKARRDYYKKVFAALRAEFGEALNAIAVAMNGAKAKK